MTTCNADDVFVHASSLREAGVDRLEAGDRVSFALAPGRGGGKQQAVRLAVIGDSQ
jgi:cold shock CspA family protein